MPKLKDTVVVRDEHFATHVLPAGSVAPDWAVPLITNPAVWDENDDTTPTPPKPKPKAKAAPAAAGKDPQAGPAEGGEDETPDPDAGAEQTITVPKKGATAKTWAAYALANGFEVEADAKAAEIRESLAAEGIPVE
ncbi:hypothetical protein AS850_02705 [Frondihabitans sp. 762G35]|uniref:hypothetical protein n=1 Tax=Frondihabitans sp. 762G35 TaxID=1446794 RepID=UPI000D2166A7|nr:hypothetical protein [Frondihabitans sp. 762G35]ARC55983.1 hypothetical protein AS850_02705 [Frondihabitans sp. 762G35]